ncbi:hypothetical protein M3Y99_00131500 [Aphelenchoides fujianensis]|nr:hypothetical protein M3Y99_00131500 [Aphelenchoides fujianensis]
MSQPTASKREAPPADSEVRPPVQPPPKKPKKNEQEPKRGARLRDEFDRLRALIDERRPGAPPCRAFDQVEVLEKARALIVETEQRAKFYELLFYAARAEATNRMLRASLLGFRMGAHFLYQRQHLGQPQLNAQMTALEQAADGMGVRMPPVPTPLPNWGAFFAPPVQQPVHSFDASMPPLLLPQQPTVSHGHSFFQPMPQPAFPPTSVPWMPFVNAPMMPTFVPPTQLQQQQPPPIVPPTQHLQQQPPLQPIVPPASIATQQLVIPPVVPPTPLKPAVSQQPAIVKPQPLTPRQQAAAAVPPTPLKKPPVGLPPLVLPSAVQKPPTIRRIVLNAIPPRVAPVGGLTANPPAAAPPAAPIAPPAAPPSVPPAIFEEEAAQEPEATEADARPIGPVPPPPPPSPASQQPKASPPPTPTPPFVPTAASSSGFPSHVFEDPAFQASAASGFGQSGGQVRPFAPPNFAKFAATIQDVLNSAVAEEGGSESSSTGPQ